jgi:hypothetical protein
MNEATGTALSPAAMRDQTPKTSRRLLVTLVGVVFLAGCAIGGVWIYNQVTCQKPLQRLLVADPRNGVLQAKAHLDGWIDPDSLVFDVTDISGNASQMDVFRVFLQYANAQKDRQYRKVVLASYGDKKFVLPGDYFHQLGQEYDAQNPVYTVRTFPHHVSTLDGAKPFPEPEGGILWVIGKEMEEFNQFNRRWYLDDYIARHK